MSIVFNPDDHSYITVENPEEKWTSVTTLLKNFKEPFDELKTATMCSTKKSSKWYGMKPEEIIEAWNKENARSITLGNWYHEQREKDVLACETINRDGLPIPIFPSETDANGRKIAPEQTLVEGIYPEHFIYLKSAGICGQADRVEVVGNRVDVYDYKSNKKIELNSFVNKMGKSKKMLPPVQHLDDCNYNHYTLQLSIYMYIILKHNPMLKPGKLMLQHVSFEVEGEDKFGYPIYKKDENGYPIVKEVTPYELPYLKEEVQMILKYLKQQGK